MTVLHVVPDNELGGGNVNVARLMRALDRGTRALLPHDALPEVEAVFDGLPHARGDYPGRGGPVAIARAILAQAGPRDLVHAHGTRAAAAACLARLRRPGLRVVYTVRGFHGLAQPGPLGVRVRAERALARWVDATVFVSAADQALAREAGLRQRRLARVIENGMPAPKGDAATAERDVDLLFVGRMVFQKHPQAFIETLARLRRPARAVMVGAGELSDEVAALTAERGVEGLERREGLSHADVLSLMARARFLVMTSRWEGLPTVAIEASLRGAVPAGFEIPPLAEVLASDAPALLTEPDPEALARRLDALLDDESGRLATASRLHAACLDRYSPEAMAQRYEEVYRAVEAARGGPSAAPVPPQQG